MLPCMDSLEDSIEDLEEEAETETASTSTNADAESTQQTNPQTSRREAANDQAGNWPEQEKETSTSDTDVGLDDDALEQVVNQRSTEITVVGCGGAGSNTVNRMVAEGISGANLLAANTDAQHLLEVDADNKILLGGTDESGVQGRGAGSLPQVGEKAALDSQHEIQAAVEDSDMVFVTAGLGGGTGTGAAPVVAQAAQENGALTISIVSTPFTSEGEIRRNNAEAGLSRLREVSDTVIVVPNDRLLDTVGEMPLDKAFKVCDEVLLRSVKGITELITESGLVNLDFSDVRTVMENGDVAMIGLGESEGSARSSERATESVQEALRSPLLDVDISGANSVLVNVTGGPDMSIEEAEGVVEALYDKVDPNARIIWGASVDESLENEIQTMLVVTGVTSPQIHGSDGENAQKIDHIE